MLSLSLGVNYSLVTYDLRVSGACSVMVWRHAGHGVVGPNTVLWGTCKSGQCLHCVEECEHIATYVVKRGEGIGQPCVISSFSKRGAQYPGP